MLITNIISIIITLAFQLVNAQLLTRNARIRNTFFYRNIIPNTFVNQSVRPYKKKVLAYSRIFLLVTIGVSLVLLFNKSMLLLVIYLIVFILGALLLPKIMISIALKQLSSLDILIDDKRAQLKLFGSLYHDPQDRNITYQYGYYRSALNTATTGGKIIIVVIVILLGGLSYLAYNSINTQEKVVKSALKYEFSDKAYEITYTDIKTSIIYEEMLEVKTIKELPEVERNLSGKQVNDYRIGEFKLAGSTTPTYLIYQSKNTNIIAITTEKFTYYISYPTNKIALEQLELLKARIIIR
ncbi:MAG: hypothetical protein ACRCTA_02890 [Bacilli bacterium]